MAGCRGPVVGAGCGTGCGTGLRGPVAGPPVISSEALLLSFRAKHFFCHFERSTKCEVEKSDHRPGHTDSWMVARAPCHYERSFSSVISSVARRAKSRNLHIQPEHTTDPLPWLVAELHAPLSFRAKHAPLSFRAKPEGRSREICTPDLAMQA